MNKLFLIFAFLLISLGTTSGIGYETSNNFANERFNTQKNKIEKTVYITKTGKKFHCQNCYHLKSCISIDKSEAIRLGYTPCKICKPN